MEAADFSGYATKADIQCSDGRTILPNAFQHQDKEQVPLVWQHGHDSPLNVLGYAVLEHRADGVYTYGFFNDTEMGQAAKKLVRHKDVKALSIYANKLVENSKKVVHGVIREVSLVLAGANPEAFIDTVSLAHGDDYEVVPDAGVVYTGLTFENFGESVEHAEGDEEEDKRSVQEIYESMSEEQKEVCHFMIGAAIDAAAQDGAEALAQAEGETDGVVVTDPEAVGTVVPNEVGTTEPNDVGTESDPAGVVVTDATASDASVANAQSTEDENLNHQEGTDMPQTRNVFDQSAVEATGPTLTHDQISTILADAKKPGATLKDSFLQHAAEYGIEDINILFPDAKTLANSPELLSRRMEWVAKVLDGTKHSPFSRIKSIVADITAEEARAKGYMKGNLKKDEVVGLLRRSTSPATIYKKQRLDRDDVIDITDMDIVAWLKAEMRLMIEEEIARAILVGDGRSTLSEDKVKDPAGSLDGVGIRSILHDSDLYSVKTELAANVSPKDAVKGLVRARSKYRGSGKPTLFISDGMLTDIMLEEDKFGRSLYETEQVLKDKLRVSDVVTVDLFDEYDNLFAIMVSLNDYTIGSTRGGELTSFEDFDIDFNQHKYLQETRLSGALTKPYSAIVVRRAVGTLAVATAPSFNGTTDTVTIPTVTGVQYTVDGVVRTGSFVITGTTEVEAEPTDGYYLESNTTRSWTYSV